MADVSIQTLLKSNLPVGATGATGPIGATGPVGDTVDEYARTLAILALPGTE